VVGGGVHCGSAVGIGGKVWKVSQGGLGQGRTDTKGGRVCEREDQSAPKKIRVLIHSWKESPSRYFVVLAG